LNSKVVREGDFFKKFFENYNDLKNDNENLNLGWELIRNHFPESLKHKICSVKEKDSIKYTKIKFLN
jgi:hypothetical protein